PRFGDMTRANVPCSWPSALCWTRIEPADADRASASVHRHGVRSDRPSYRADDWWYSAAARSSLLRQDTGSVLRDSTFRHPGPRHTRHSRFARAALIPARPGSRAVVLRVRAARRGGKTPAL